MQSKLEGTDQNPKDLTEYMDPQFQNHKNLHWMVG